MAPRLTRSERLGQRLDALVASHDAAARRETDPVGLVHRAPRAEQEVVGLIAARRGVVRGDEGVESLPEPRGAREPRGHRCGKPRR
ncbi:MAG: hypothetical protein RLP09_21835, partial [Sandaracinaceae bacterium]